jgi:hypothetical protein
VVARVRIPLGALTAEDPAALRATMMIFGGFAFQSGTDAAEAGGADLGVESKSRRFEGLVTPQWAAVGVSLLPTAMVRSSGQTEQRKRSA